MDCSKTESEKLTQAIEDYRAYRDAVGRDGIGRLSEKSLHGVLKFMVDPDLSHHEIALPQGVVADLFDGTAVTEIQTGTYLALQKKLPRILPHYSVRVICPIVRDRYLYSVDRESGAVEGGRKSPLHGDTVTCLVAMAYLDRFLEDPNFSVSFWLCDTADYRARVGSGKGRARYEKLDREPLCIVRTWSVTKREDYMAMLPASLPMPFTAEEFAKAAHLRGRNASAVLKLLRSSGTVRQIGCKGRAYLYTVTTNENEVCIHQEVQYE